jgi:Leucine-rich repeat (LRR) protein
MDVFYSRLPSNAASDAKVWVNDVYSNGNQNNSDGSNKIIANDSGWKVWSAGLTSDSELTGDGGGCNFTYIPDIYFLQALKDKGYGDNAYGKRIPTANLSGITTLDVRSRYIDNLTGIQDFVALKELNCSNNKLTSLDVSKNTKLTKLITGQTSLSVLDVSKNTDLTYLWCDENKLTTLDLSKNTKLTTLSCKNNELTTLDMRNGNNANVTDFDATNNPNLSCIYVDNKAASYLPRWRKDATAKFVNTESECGATVAYTNIPDNNFLQALKDLGHGTGAVGNDIPTANLSTITSLTLTYKDISSLTGIKDFAALEILKCDGNNLTSLDVSKNIALTFLDCEQNQITILNVSGNTALRILNCADNALTSINLSKNVALEELICYENQIESIDVSKNTKLISLKCSSNLIPILDVSKNTALTDIDCVDNDLKTLDVSKNTALKDLDCRYNKISVLDLSMNTKLTGLYCNDNELISLDVRNGNNANVTHFNATNNPNLSCIYVDNKTASYLSGWKKDASARFFNNESECGTSVNDFKEQDISIYPNPTNGIVNFDFAENRVQSIKISDVVGKMVFVKNNPNQKEEIDLSSFVSGIYIVTVQMHKENRSFKIIKQ